MKVVIADNADEARWDAYVAQRELHHSFSWQWKPILESVFGHTPLYLLASDEKNRVLGILPLFLVRSFLFGTSLIGVPYLNGGGVIAESSEAAGALLLEAIRLSDGHKAKYLELRERTTPAFAQAYADSGTFVERSHKAAMLLEINADPQVVFGRFSAKLRSQVRRPTKDGVRAESTLGNSGSESDRLVKHFYEVFAENMRDLGTPVYSRALFERTVTAFGSRARIIVCYTGELPIAAGITIRSSGSHNISVEIPWASSLREHNKLSANMLLYWTAIEAACNDGAHTFDFGRSSIDSGPYRFKQQWGALPQVLHWQYYSSQNAIPDINPQSSKFQIMVQCWQKLPLAAANLLGPWLTKSLP